ncbi:MAG: di-trans,poly-cis-decaprenylcistransferase [Planctomycetes bacterium]|nr:di-trans,poly-cis-decaprenylcistransferase [Planctomycetota bacterium]
MDGNGRWAKSAGLERIRGHERGIDAVRTTVTECARLGVEALVLYAFSEENWQRPQREIDLLFGLLKRFLVEERDTLMQNRVRLLHVGRRQRLAPDVLERLDAAVALTANNAGMRLGLAIAYGGRQELVDGVQRIAAAVRAGRLEPAAIDEATVRAHLYHPELPDPDLLIRTAGEQRISNFLLWQTSYAEFHACAKCWPEFGAAELHEAFRDYGRRTRKFGKVP